MGFDKSAFESRFREETTEHLARLEADLLELEKDAGNRKLLEDMMREAHTMKGAASMMGHGRIANLAHAIEDALSRIGKGEVEPDQRYFELLFKTLDSVKPLLLGEGDGFADTQSAPVAPERPAPRSDEGRVRDSGGGRSEPSSEGPSAAADGGADRATGGPPVGWSTPVESIRVDVRKLNQLMNLVGELVIGKIRLDQRRAELDGLVPDVEELYQRVRQAGDEQLTRLARTVADGLSRGMEELHRAADEMGFVVSQMQGSVMAVRMLPLDVLFGRFPRAVRDLSKQLEKPVELRIAGGETELDKTVLERIQDPLMHIVRNAVGHGIEPVEERRKIGKPETGTIELTACCKGSQVIIEVADDGRGIDPEKVRSAAVEKGIVSAEEAEHLTEAQVLDLLFAPGFTTRDGVSELSGRGVGLDVVRENVTQLKGHIEVSSEVGKGTRFTIRLPLTLAVTSALLVRIRGETFALPLDNIEETMRMESGEVKRVEGREAICVRDEIIPLVALGDVLGIPEPVRAEERRYVPVVVVGTGQRKLAVAVDELAGKLDVVAKNLGDHLAKVEHIAGATLSGTGTVIPILDVPSLMSEASRLHGLDRPLQARREERKRGSVLVVEDSVITRDLERSILEAADYEVDVAKDGADALNKLAQGRYQLVLTDISMPVMDGIEMIREMRKDARLSEIPVIVVSSQESEDDVRRGLEAGATAYLGKKTFDQTDLLDTVERLIGWSNRRMAGSAF